MIIIGSRALAFYRNIERQPADLDIMVDGTKLSSIPTSYRWRRWGIEAWVCHPASPYKSDWLAFNYAKEYGAKVGRHIYAPVDLLKVLKLSCADYLNKPKHIADLAYLEDVELSEDMLALVKLRSLETQLRVEAQRKMFFDKYAINRQIPHDQLHKIIAEHPAYQKLLVDAVTPSKAKFVVMSDTDRVQIVLEEVMALTLERFVLSQPSKLAVAAALGQIANFKSQAPQYWLNRLGSNMNDNPGWFRDWISQNKSLIIDAHSECWSNMYSRSKEQILSL